MPAAGNTGGAGGAKNVARAQRKPKRAAPAPPSFPKFVPKKPGQLPPQARRQATLARSLPKVTGPVREAPKRLQSPSAAAATSVRKRAKRVEISATRRRTGGGTGETAPIIVRRRAEVARVPRELAKLEKTGRDLGVLAKPKPKYAKVAKAKRPKESSLLGGGLGLVTGAAKFADKALSGESFLSKGASTAAGAVGTGIESATTGRYLKKPFAAVGLKWREPQGAAAAVSRRAKAGGKELVDLPANFIPSVYVPGKESAKSIPALARGKPKEALEHQVKAIKTVAEPIVETVKHPRKSFEKNPIGTSLIFAGGEGAIGRGAGAALRKGAAGKAGRRVARTERVNRVVPGTGAEVRRSYDPDIIRKGVQVAGEKVAARRRKGKDRPSDRRMTDRDIKHEVDQDVRIGRNVTTLADERAATNVAHAVNPPREIGKHIKVRRKVRNKPVTAAHTVAVQGLTNATKADVERLLAETEAKAKDLGGDKLRQNEKRQKELRKALKKWKPETEAHIRDVQGRVREQTAVEETDLVKAGVLDASRTDANRYAPAAVRHGLHDPEASAKHVAEAGKAAAKAAGARRGAHRSRQAANAALREQTAKTRAAELGPRGETRAGTTAAEREVRGHEKTLQKAKEQEARDLATARKELDDARHAAGIAEIKPEKAQPHPEMLEAIARLDKANADLAALTKQATGRERVSGRQEGRAQEKVAAHERGRAATARRLSEEADRRQTELAVHNRTVATVEKAAERGGRAYSPKQVEAVRRRRDAAQKRADAADAALTRHHAEGGRKGTEPRNVLAGVERRGGEEVHLRQRILAARAEVENATSVHARAQAKAKGVPPKEAERLRRAIAGHDDARLRFTDRDSLEHLRDNVDAAKAKLAYEQSKGGLEPAAATRLWKAIHDAEDATAAHVKAIAEHEAATAHHRALKDAPYISSKGVPHTVEDVRSHPAMSGQPEPSFMPHAYESAHGAVPVNKVKAPNPVKQRTGLMVTEGTSPVSGGQLATARVARSRMVTAAHNRIAIIDKWGYREKGTPTTEPATVYSTKGIAEKAAAEAERVTGHPMTPFADQRTDGYVLVPRSVTKRLAEHEETVLHRDQVIKRFGRAWRTGVLALSTRWLTGQWAEPALRMAITHNLNPVKLARSYRLLSRTAKELKAADPEAFARFESLYKRGGVSRGVKVSRDEALNDFLMHDAAGGLHSAARWFGERRGGKQLHALGGAWQRLWFHWLNGSIESLARRGLVGHELIKDPIIRDRKFALSFGQAAKDLAEGLKDTPAQNRVARGVDDAFGKYQGRSPKEQAIIENVTPFIPWFLSSMKFLYWVLPRDHPVLTALGASSSQATEEWRRKYGIYFDPTAAGGMGVAGTDKNLPLTRQGSIPVGKNNESTVNVSHLGPFGGPQGFGDVGSFLFPAVQDIIAASGGKDFRGYSLTGRDEPVSLQRILEATASSALTTVAPPVGVAAKLAGVRLPSEPDLAEGEKEPGFGERLGKQFNPLPVKPGLKKGTAERKAKRKAASQRANAKRRKKGPGPLSLSSGGGGGGGLKLGGGSSGSGLKLGG